MTLNENPLEDRILTFLAALVNLTRSLDNDHADKHMAKNLLECSGRMLASQTEAEAQSRQKEFIQYMAVALKESREVLTWLKLVNKSVAFDDTDFFDKLLLESKTLVALFHETLEGAIKDSQISPNRVKNSFSPTDS